MCPRLAVGEAPESSDRQRWNRGDRESSSSSRGRGEIGGLEQGLMVGLRSMGLAPPPSVSIGTVLGLRSTSMGAGLWLGLGRSSSTGSGAGLGLEARLWTGLRSGDGAGEGG